MTSNASSGTKASHSESTSAFHVAKTGSVGDQQAAYLKIQSKKRTRLLERREDLDRSIRKCETRMDVAGDPHLFDKMTGFLASKHEVSKELVSSLRDTVRRL